MIILDYLKEAFFKCKMFVSNFASNIISKLRQSKLLAVIVVIIIILYYPIGMAIINNIDDDIDFFNNVEIKPNQSRAVGVSQALINREVRINRWTAMDPFFFPSAALDNMPNFQQGIMAALSRFAIEMSDQIGRVRGSSQVDDDLDKAVGLLKYKGDIWIYDLSESLLPQRSSAQQYGLGADAFGRYNQRLGNDQAVFERRADNLLATLDRFSADIGSISAVLDSAISDLSIFSFDSDDVFYRNKGRLYAYYLLMREMGHDFKEVLAEKRLDTIWQQTLLSLRQAAAMDPLVILNAAPDSFILPSHLAAQGFYLLRARTQISEISNVLLK